MKRLVILGSTGSIGVNALRVAEALAPRFKVVGLAANRGATRVLEQARRFGVEHVAVSDPAAARECAAAAPSGVAVHAGPEGVARLAEVAGADLVVCAISGAAGLAPVLAAVERGTDVALATKEVLVVAGERVTRACLRTGARLLPIDSEHSAVFQCLGQTRTARAEGARPMSEVRAIILTASGGPFAARPEVDLASVTADQALNHPRWNMGRKVTVDSATLMNKGLEVMEAQWLFDVPLERIEVLIHPESLVHSLVEYVDGSLLAQLSVPDMRLAIQYALTWPERCDGGLPRLSLADARALHFQPPDERRFPCLALARRAAAQGGLAPAVLNAANEVAVDRFLSREIPFPGIWRLVEHALNAHRPEAAPSLETILAADAWARRAARAWRPD